ncbi:insecticyanin-A-like isoform X1 [Manduca sexta]|uniref:insecticyanin-A-like isoform X1 n=1 Tax=Manduca sexta TaxID=7130 RepID=UPI00188ED890|nr:insecticyanin-A-like isoform X1 [Manduca sexta]
MLKILIICACVCNVFCYFTLLGKCPENLKVQEEFRLADFFGKWYQSYHYSSDGQSKNNCSVLELVTKPTGIYLNQSRIDRGLFQRYSMGKLEIPTKIEDAAKLDLTFVFDNAPRRLRTRRYPFYVIATNYNFYATIYTCEYSPLINKHFIYVWILSRNQILNDVSKDLAVKPLSQIGLDASKLTMDEFSKCNPKYYTDEPTEPMTFRYPVPI